VNRTPDSVLKGKAMDTTRPDDTTGPHTPASRREAWDDGTPRSRVKALRRQAPFWVVIFALLLMLPLWIVLHLHFGPSDGWGVVALVHVAGAAGLLGLPASLALRASARSARLSEKFPTQPPPLTGWRAAARIGVWVTAAGVVAATLAWDAPLLSITPVMWVIAGLARLASIILLAAAPLVLLHWREARAVARIAGLAGREMQTEVVEASLVERRDDHLRNARTPWYLAMMVFVVTTNVGSGWDDGHSKVALLVTAICVALGVLALLVTFVLPNPAGSDHPSSVQSIGRLTGWRLAAGAVLYATLASGFFAYFILHGFEGGATFWPWPEGLSLFAPLLLVLSLRTLLHADEFRALDRRLRGEAAEMAGSG
jgi:hypothetical protein